MHDLDAGCAVVVISPSAPPRPTRTISPSSRAPVRGSPGPLEQHEADALGVRLLVALERGHDRVGVDRGIELGRQARARRGARATSARSPSAPESRSAASRPKRDGLAMAVAPVARRRLDRVTDRVAEVQDLAAAGVALVLGDDVDLRPRAVEDDVAELCRRRATRATRTRSHSAPPAISAVFTTSAKPAASSSGGSVASAPGSARTAVGMW